MKPFKDFIHEKEYDTKTLYTDLSPVSEDTKETVDRKNMADSEIAITIGKKTQVYEPRPLTPDDDIYEDIIEQFASAPTKPKYWFEEFGDYWSCSCGHINRGDRCKSCGLERDLLRSLFILHKPSNEPGKLGRKLKRTKEDADREEQDHTVKENRRKQREASGEDLTKVVPIEDAKDANADDDAVAAWQRAFGKTMPADAKPVSYAAANTSAAPDPATPSMPAKPLKPPKSRRFKIGLIIAIVLCLLLVGICAAIIYVRIASPAMKYDEAQEAQKAGQYEEAIKKYEALGDYKDAEPLIWECYMAMGDDLYDAGSYEEAINTYQIAADMKIAVDTADGADPVDKIRDCYIAIGDRYATKGKYKKALSTYETALEKDKSGDMREAINERIHAAKFGYVKANLSKRTAQVETYMAELMDMHYPDIQEIYDEYYAWHVSIVANTSETDFSTDLDTVSRKDTVYFHASLSGGEPDEILELYYEVSWPSGSSEIYGLDSKWQAGSNITARFQYPIPLFGKEGDLTFTLYNKNTNEIMGSDTITFQN